MSDPLHAALADLRARRDKLDAAIGGLEDLLGLEPGSNGVESELADSGKRNTEIPPARGRARPRASSSFDDAVLTYLTAHGETAPRELAKRMKLSVYALRQKLKPLEGTGRVVLTGATMNRRVALPGRAPAKEAP